MVGQQIIVVRGRSSCLRNLLENGHDMEATDYSTHRKVLGMV